MFAPLKTWRRWHKKCNINQRRYAVTSAIAATGVPALVMAKGHRVDEVPEIPLVVSNNAQDYKKTKQAVDLLKKLGAWDDVKRVYASRRMRAGRGKSRDRKHVQKLGPALVYAQDNGIVRAFRNIPGVEVLDVNSLNVLRLAPGGHVGRFLIFTEDAFKALDNIYGNFSAGSSAKKNWSIPSAVIQNSDLQAMLQSDEVQSVLNAPKSSDTTKRTTKKNPLTNIRAMLKLNPNAAAEKRAAWRVQEAAKKAKN
jgi:large subunit ribosomal protein L4e